MSPQELEKLQVPRPAERASATGGKEEQKGGERENKTLKHN